MAGIITNVGEDIKSLQQLRQEIENVKKTLGSIDINVKIDIRKELEQRLQSLTKQYDILVEKAAEADAKLMESAKRIDKAVDTITAAQEKVVKANTLHAADMTHKTQAAAVEVQTKAYIDLKDEIDAVLGTREQNIQQMLQEQNAIRIINAEIAQINKSRQYGSGLTAIQSQRLQQLNDDLLTHKQALAEVRQELNNNAKLDIAAVGSMNELSQSLSRMRIAYRALNEDERNSQFGKSLLSSIQEADAKIKELDSTIGNHQRNVGNYQGSFNGLNMSVQQIVRELPSAKMGINMFFMAISNNLPIMVDQIKYAKEANAAMKAAGQEPVPVWKQLVSSLFSWQSAMMVGITLLTIYGKDVANWVKELFKANDAQEQARKEAEAFTKTVQKAHEEWRNSVAQTAAQQITEYRKMQREWNKLGNDLNAKKKYVDANKTAFHQLGFAVNGVSDAERVMTGNTDAVVASIMARAKASAYYAQMQEATERYIKQTDYNKSTVAGGGYYDVFAPKDNQTENASELKGLKEGVDYTKVTSGAGAYAKLVYTYTAKGIAKVNKRRAMKAAELLAENQKKAKDQLDKQISSLQDGLEAVTKENQGLLKKIGVSEYKNYEDRKEKQKKESVAKQVDYNKMQREQSEAERNLENAVAQSRIDAMQEGYEKEKAQRELNHKKELNDIDKKRSDFLQRKIDDAKQIFNADPKNKGKKFNYSSVKLSATEQEKFDEMRVNTLKKYANEEKDYQKQLINALNDYLKDYGSMQERRLAIAKEYDEKITKAQSEGERLSLNAQKAKALSDFDLTEEKKNLNWEDIFGDLGNQTIEQLEAVKRKLREMLNSDNLDVEGYKTAVEQIEKVNNAIIDAQDKQRSFFDFSTSYTKERRKLEMDVADALQRQNDAITKQKTAQGNLLSKQIGITQLLSNYGINHKDDITASKIEEILKEVEKKYGTDSEAYKKVRNAMEDLGASERELIEANEKKKKADNNTVKSQDKLDKFLKDLPKKMEGFMQAFDRVLVNINSLPDLFSQLGISEDSAVMRGTKHAVDAANSTHSALTDLMSGNVIGAAANSIKAVKSIGKSVEAFFNMDGVKQEKAFQSAAAKYEALNDVWDSLISKKKEYLNMSWGTEAAQTQDEIEKLYKSEIKGTQAVAESLLHTKEKHHGSSHGLGTWETSWWSNNGNYAKHANNNSNFWRNLSSELSGKGMDKDANGAPINITRIDDFFHLTYKQLEYIKQKYADLWATQDKRLKTYLDLYMSQMDAMEKATNNATDSIIGSISELTDALASFATDSDKSMADVMDSFNKTINKEIWESLTKGKDTDYYQRMQAYQQHWKDAEENDGKISVEEKNRLAEEYQSIYRDVKAEYDRKTSELGTNGLSNEQKATANGVTSITFEQANNIVALTTAGNVSRDQIKERLSLMNATMDDIRALMSQTFSSTPDYANSNRAIINNSYTPQIQVSFPKEELQNINGKMGTILAVVDEMRTHGVESLMEQKALSRDTEKIVMGNKEMLSCVNDFRRDFNKQY